MGTSQDSLCNTAGARGEDVEVLFKQLPGSDTRRDEASCAGHVQDSAAVYTQACKQLCHAGTVVAGQDLDVVPAVVAGKPLRPREAERKLAHRAVVPRRRDLNRPYKRNAHKPTRWWR